MGLKCVLVSSGQPSANPRMLKEAKALLGVGYMVTVIYCPLSPWADAMDQKLFKQLPQIHWIKVGYHPTKERFRYQLVRIRRKIYEWLFLFLGNKLHAAERSLVFYSQELVNAACKVKADLYIGHNLGALPAVIAAAKKNHGKAGFDFEDFHRGEDLENSLHWKKVTVIEEKYVPSLSYATTASPLMRDAYQQLFPTVSFTTINNCFPLVYQSSLTEIPTEPLKLFWFSQIIGQKRGLETVIKAMGILKEKNIRLSLLGNCTEVVKEYFIRLFLEAGLQKEHLVFMEPVDEDRIVSIAAQHHIGLASEESSILNRELCLTNKIFMYMLAGNAILFSSTRAQGLFAGTYPGIGKIYKEKDAEQLAQRIREYLDDPVLLHAHRLASFQLAKKELNWDREKELYLSKTGEALIP
ncbi:MAG TPA: hypothetical protein VFN30_15405 [Chitinophagaceae bacterium]|nr:hypothetical protein [Chitinophagaceae bacterium]